MKTTKKRFHISCSKIDGTQLFEPESGVGTWYCTDCRTGCDLCSGALLNGIKTVYCDRCETWIYTERSFISEAEYGTLVKSNCSWICIKCEILNFSDSLFREIIELDKI